MRSHSRLAALARRQHGVVSFRQLRELGFSKGAIDRHGRAERLLRVHRGVYAVGHLDLSDHGRCVAAILACGRGTVLSHGSAEWLLGLFPTHPKHVEVTVPKGARKHPGITTHGNTLAGGEWGHQEDLPVTSPARTLLDLAATRPPKALARSVDRAERRGLLDLIEIDSLLARHQGERGTKRLLDALDLHRDPAFNRSRAERLFLALLKKSGVPRPAMNVFVAGYELDAYWESERFAVEVDGWESHRTRAAFESDRLRQENLKLAGIDSVRITARRIEREPKAVGERLAALLSRQRHAPEPRG